MTCATGIHTLVAFNTIVHVNGINKGNGLIEGNRNCLPHAHVHVPFVREFYGTNVSTLAAACAVLSNYVPRVFPNLHLEVSYKTFYAEKVGVRYYFDIRMARDIHHLWSFDAYGAVEGWKGFV